MIVLVLLIAVAGGGTAYYFYCWSDEGLRQMILRQLEATAPTLKFEIARVRGDMIGRVYIYGLTVRLPDDDDEKPAIELPKIEATLEQRPLTDFENVVIQKLRIINPKIRAVRSPDGSWNLKQIALEPSSNNSLPEIEIEHGTVTAEFQLPHRNSRRLKFQHFNVSVAPTDSRRLAIQVATLLEPAGPLMLDISLNLDGPKWECVTRDPWKVPVDSKLIQLLSDISPEVGDSVAKLGKWMEAAKTMKVSAAHPLPDDSAAANATRKAGAAVPDFGLRCLCELTVQVSQNQPGDTPQFRVLTAIKDGQLTNDLLPLALHELQGKILVDSRQIIVSDVKACNGPMHFSFDGEVVPSKPIQGVMKLRGIELNDELIARVPEELRKVLVPLGVTGVCDADVVVTHDSGRWEPQVDLQLSRGTVTEKHFPVTVRNVEGTLKLRKNVVTFRATGKYANQGVTVDGTVTNPGPAHSAEIVMKSANLPLDDETLEACPAAVQQTIRALNLTCRHDLWLRLTKPEGVGTKYRPELTERIHEGRMAFNGFRYEIQNLEGMVKWSGDDVTFTNLTGTHDGTALTANGSFRRNPGRGMLDLNIEAQDAAFDRSLKDAMPEKLKQVWNDFQPRGLFNIKTKINWIPGQPCDIEIPNIVVRNGEVLMRSFPWSLQNLRGEFAYSTKTGRLEMKELYAKHDDTQVSASGFGSFPPGDFWRLKFTQLNIDNLVPNATFRNALPERMQKVFDHLRPEGDFSFYGPVEFSGPPERGDSVTAAWNLKTVLSRCSIHAGTHIDDIYGVVQLEGNWDGSHANLKGDLKLDTVSVFRKSTGQAYQISNIRGPFSYHNDELVAGTKSAIPPRKAAPDPDQRISGKVIGGTVYLDAAVTAAPESNYVVFVELEKGLLERYARQYLGGQSNLAGVMNGWITLRGKGSGADKMIGDGKLRIAPAALYELPVFVQMFSLPQLRVPDKTAFEQADVDFTVADERFDFRSIELIGDAMSLRGRGYVRFDGGMQLEFGSRPGRGYRRMFQNLLGAEWIAVRVTGNVGNPNVAYIPLPAWDDAMRQLFDPRNMPPAARFAPRTGQKSEAGMR